MGMGRVGRAGAEWCRCTETGGRCEGWAGDDERAG